MRYFTEEDVRRSLPIADVIQSLRTAFVALDAGEAVNQPRRRMFLKTGAVLHSLAGAYGPYFGTKVYSTHPRYGAWFTFLLFDAETGRPLAQFEANYLGQIRTGATTGLAADLVARWSEVDVAVIGSGFQARSQVEAVAAVRKIRSLKIWSRSEDKRRIFASDMETLLQIPAQPAASSPEATAAAHIVITATSAKTPVLEESAVRPDALILAMGSNNPKRREIPAEIILSSDVVVDDPDAARTEAGDLLLAFSEEDWERVIPLAALAAGKTKAGQGGRRVVFKSVGLGLEDVAAAALVYERNHS